MIDENEFLLSQFSDTQRTNATLGVQPLLKLCKAVTEDRKSRAWRVTLSRLDRNDGTAPLVPQSPSSPVALFQDGSYGYAAGADELGVFASPVPPRRSNPVFGAQSPANGFLADPVFVQVQWGMEQGRANRMIAHWPAQGGSFVVEASYVEVWGGVATRSATLGTPPVTNSEFPSLAALISPVAGLPSSDAGELSIQQLVAVALPEVLLTPPAAPALVDTSLGIIVGGTPALPSANMFGSAVYNVAPFNVWSARIRSQDRLTPRTVVIFTASTVPQFELRDNEVPDAAGVFGPSAGNVGIVYRTDGVTGIKTISDWNALIDSSSLLTVVSATGTPTDKLLAGYKSPAVGPTSVGLAQFLIGAPRAGAAVYVPDFARRVRVQGVRQDTTYAGVNWRVPQGGPIPLQLVWYDDQGFVVDAAIQGVAVDPLAPSLGTTTINAPVEWQAVPARAVMLGIYGFDYTTDRNTAEDRALVHWRLAP